MSDLTTLSCIPCKGGVPPLTGPALSTLMARLGPGWRLDGEHHIEKDFAFRDFNDALAFTNRVGALAEKEGHHPDIHLSWGKVTLTIFTHKINGLSESDFILAAKTDQLL